MVWDVARPSRMRTRAAHAHVARLVDECLQRYEHLHSCLEKRDEGETPTVSSGSLMLP